jgi:hypothetical protein
LTFSWLPQLLYLILSAKASTVWIIPNLT